MEYFDIVDENGIKTGAVIERNKAHALGVCHRCVIVWVVNSNKQLLIQKRSSTKDICPDMWYASLAGHIEAGENAQETIVREFKEELGLDININEVKYLYTFHEKSVFEEFSIIDNEVNDVYILKTDLNIKDLILQKEEVSEVKFIDYISFKEMIKNNDPTFWIHNDGFLPLFNYLDEVL